jgi:hypothetical protein
MLADATLRASLLTPWTQAARHSFGLELLGFVGKQIQEGTAWRGLNDSFKGALERRGINEADWSVILKSQTHSRRDLPYASIVEIAETDPRVAAKLNQVITEETEFATPSGSARIRAMLKQGTQAGTLAGEIMRSTAMYKQFPLLLLNTHMWRGLYGAGEANRSGTGYLADLFITTTILGAAAMQAKQIAAGKDPVPVVEDGVPSGKFFAAAALQGGALGIFGDFLFADQSRFGKGVVASAAGPVAGVADDFGRFVIGNTQEIVTGQESKIGREATQMLRRYTPGGNLWYTRMAFERMVLDRMQMMVDPHAHRSFNQRESKLRQDYGTEFFWGPGETAPSRGPDFGNVSQ